MSRALAAVVLLATSSAAPAAELEVGYGQEHLTRGREWRELSATAAWREPKRPAFELAVRGLERFGLRDVELSVAASVPVGSRWTVAGEASSSPEHRFVPAFSGAASLQRALGGGLVASAAARWSLYEGDAGTTRTGVGALGLERYWGAFRLGWTGYLGTLHGRWSASNAAAFDLYYREADRVGVRVAAGRELESVGGAVLVSDVLAAGVTGRHALSRAWALTFDAGVQRQGDLYTRTGARLGLRRQF